ncbi:unnamed protein product [Amoebophrya sp. A25]|nr:unnamed protein product [Amoebophrya sp. A25]|eukprot:GSA25T00017250001.1
MLVLCSHYSSEQKTMATAYVDRARLALDEFRRADLISLVGQDLLNHLKQPTKGSKQVPKALRHLYFPPSAIFTEGSTTEFSRGRVLRVKQVRADITEAELVLAVGRTLLFDLRDEGRKQRLLRAALHDVEGGLSALDIDHSSHLPSGEGVNSSSWLRIHVGKATKEESQYAAPGQRDATKEVITVHVSIVPGGEEWISENLLNVAFERWEKACDKYLSPSKSWRLKCDWGRYVTVDQEEAERLELAASELKEALARGDWDGGATGGSDHPGGS